jgi:Leucine-rich repeat (LRR) protein
MTKLKDLSLGFPFQLKIKSSENLLSLTSLDLCGSCVHGKILSKMSSLKSLSLSGTGTVSGKYIADKTNLTKLDLSCNDRIKPYALKNLTNLTHLDIQDSLISKSDTTHLLNLTKLIQ